MIWSPFWRGLRRAHGFSSSSNTPGTHTQVWACTSERTEVAAGRIRGEDEARVKRRRRNWLIYKELNSCWERAAYLPTTANMYLFSIRWKALFLSLIFFCSDSLGSLFRVGEKKGTVPGWIVLAKRPTSHSKLQPIRRSWQRQLRPSATTWLFTVCKRKMYLGGSSLLVQQTHTQKSRAWMNYLILVLVVFSCCCLWVWDRAVKQMIIGGCRRSSSS